LPILNEFESPYLASHTACLILPIELLINPKLNILKLPDLPVNRRFTSRVFKFKYILNKQKSIKILFLFKL
jgi:hypothetical protein